MAFRFYKDDSVTQLMRGVVISTTFFVAIAFGLRALNDAEIIGPDNFLVVLIGYTGLVGLLYGLYAIYYKYEISEALHVSRPGTRYFAIIAEVFLAAFLSIGFKTFIADHHAEIAHNFLIHYKSKDLIMGFSIISFLYAIIILLFFDLLAEFFE